jgi:drug/metabolite transporter (DMT)-like permease
MKREMILLVLTGIIYGTVVPLVQFLSNIGLSSYEIAVFTTIPPTILFFVLSVTKKKNLQRKDIKFFLLFGFLNSILELV